jgi:hypothetical protein
MKTLLLSAFLSLTFLQLNAQCTENVGSFGNNTSTQSYNISGDISVILNTNNSVSVNFENNFSTASGPDVRLYLVNSEGKSVSELKSINPNNLDNISFGLIGFSGAQNYTQTIPNNKDITKYDTVFLYCLQFNAFWDLGKYNSFNNSTCSVLNTYNFTIDKITFYPNPAKDKIQFSNSDNLSAEIRIFNVLGKQVYHQPKITEKTIDISSFSKGIYIVKINIDGKSKTQKLVVQ